MLACAADRSAPLLKNFTPLFEFHRKLRILVNRGFGLKSHSFYKHADDRDCTLCDTGLQIGDVSCGLSRPAKAQVRSNSSCAQYVMLQIRPIQTNIARRRERDAPCYRRVLNPRAVGFERKRLGSFCLLRLLPMQRIGADCLGPWRLTT